MSLSSTTLRLLVVAICWSILHTITFALPPGFVYLEDIDASIIQDIKFGTANNIVGHPLPGYKKPRCILTKEAALALRQAQSALRKLGLSLKVFQAYQPRQSGDYLKAWKQQNKNNKDVRAWDHYFSYTSKKACDDPFCYSQGSTVVLVIIDISPSGEKFLKKYGGLMGQLGYHIGKNSSFFLTDPPASFEMNMAEDIYDMLKAYFEVMHMHNFKFDYVPGSFPWLINFTLRNQPFPNTKFDFPVE